MTTPLHDAANGKDLDKLQQLIASGDDLGARDKHGRTPLMYAAIFDCRSNAEFIVEKCTIQHLEAVDNTGLNVLHLMAFFNRHWENVMQSIMDKCPHTLHRKDNSGKRPIDTAKGFLPESQAVYDILQRLEEKQQEQQRYMAGIADNMEEPCNVIITVVGHQGVGKTCLVQQLKKKPIPKGDPGSTNMADFDVNYLGYNPDTGLRRSLDGDAETVTRLQRLKRIIEKTGDSVQTPKTVDPQVNADNTWEGKTNLRQKASEPTTLMSATSKPKQRPDTHVPMPQTSATSKPERRPKTHVPVSDIPFRIKTVFTEVKKRAEQFMSSKLPFSRKGGAYAPLKEDGDDVTEEDKPIEHDVITEEQRNDMETVLKTKLDDKGELKGYITIYDFAGEKVFYNTHHCFMSNNMVFLLVFNVDMCLDPERSKDGYEFIEDWLRSIATYAIDKAAPHKGTPPIILVGSHMDLVLGDEDERIKQFDSVIEELKKKPDLSNIIDRHVQEMIPIANLNDDTKNQDIYEELWKTIIEIAPFQSQWKKPVPARWVALEHALVKRKHEGKVILTFAELLEINKKATVPLEENEVKGFLIHMKYSGSFLCFNLHSMDPLIILEPQWIIDAFKSVITAPKFASKSTKLRLQWNEYEKSGVLKMDLIEKLLEHRFLEVKDILFIAMETLGLLAKPIPGGAGPVPDGVKEIPGGEDVDYFIVPSMLQIEGPDVIHSVLREHDSVTTITLCLKFDNPFIPQAIWDKLIASCIPRFRLLKHNGLKFVRRGFACLSVDCLWNMIINCSNNAMKVTMFKTDKDKTIPPGTGITLLRILEFLLRKIMKTNYQSHLRYQFYLHNDFWFTSNETMVKVEDLRKNKHLQCDGSRGPKWLDHKDLYTWFENTDSKLHSDTTKTSLTAKEIGRISRYIDVGGYFRFFTELGCPSTKVGQEMADHRDLGFRSKMTKILIHILRKNPDTDLGAVTDAMSRNGMNCSELENIFEVNRKDIFDDQPLRKQWLNTKLSGEHLPIIAQHIVPKDYFILFIELGMEPGRIEEFDVGGCYRDKIRQKITALLEAFIRDTASPPTLNDILLAMKECDMDTISLITALRK